MSLNSVALQWYASNLFYVANNYDVNENTPVANSAIMKVMHIPGYLYIVYLKL